MGKLNLYENWIELSAFGLLVLGFFLATTLGSAVVSYIIIFLCGATAGRVLFRLKPTLKFPWIFITAGFLVGFALGSFYGSKIMIVVFFVVGTYASYYAHEEGYIKGF
ncbi:hypothetical protein CMO89_01215 [Candidatus Woesearchaeota archaeon]|nr:hypothetical protein [Candidatus Woesearchaeota archaeon]|tara:strand:- start:5846 stop:6169 length:324 start_codon:yes stop_codon:yes gene_type:complete